MKIIMTLEKEIRQQFGENVIGSKYEKEGKVIEVVNDHEGILEVTITERDKWPAKKFLTGDKLFNSHKEAFWEDRR